MGQAVWGELHAVCAMCRLPQQGSARGPVKAGVLLWLRFHRTLLHGFMQVEAESEALQGCNVYIANFQGYK